MVCYSSPFVTFGLMEGAENSGRGIPRDILNAEAASPPFGQFPAVPVKTMISVSNVSMRYGAKVLFDEVSTGFTPGKRYGLTGPNGAGKSTFMNLLTGELEPQKGTVVRPKKLGVLSQDQFAFDKYRVLDTVIMGNKRLWAAMEERDRIYSKPEMTDADGMKLGELEGVVGEEDALAPVKIMEVMAARIPHARLVKVASAGHSVYFERPDEFNRIVAGFLDEAVAR